MDQAIFELKRSAYLCLLNAGLKVCAATPGHSLRILRKDLNLELAGLRDSSISRAGVTGTSHYLGFYLSAGDLTIYPLSLLRSES